MFFSLGASFAGGFDGGVFLGGGDLFLFVFASLNSALWAITLDFFQVVVMLDD